MSFLLVVALLAGFVFAVGGAHLLAALVGSGKSRHLRYSSRLAMVPTLLAPALLGVASSMSGGNNMEVAVMAILMGVVAVGSWAGFFVCCVRRGKITSNDDGPGLSPS